MRLRGGSFDRRAAEDVEVNNSAAEPQLNEVGFEEPAVWSQELSFVRKDIKLAWGEMREDGYLISLY